MSLSPTLGEVGEDAVIAAIRDAAPSSINGDDAAVLPAASPNSRTVLATDTLVEGRHFNLIWSTPEDVGEKAVVQNFADIEAMGARPVAILLALSAPLDTPLETVRGIAQGIGKRCAKYNAELIGGDVTTSTELILTISAIGHLGGDRPGLSLGAARAGQKVVAHGKLGWSAAGLALLQEFGPVLPREFEHLEPLVTHHRQPWIDPGRGVIARATGATAMTDNSDGLVEDLGDIARESAVLIDLDSQAIAPDDLLVAAGKALDQDPWAWVLGGGEDHTLLATTAKDAPSGFRVIGEVAKGHGVTVDGNPPAYNSSWESFHE